MTPCNSSTRDPGSVRLATGQPHGSFSHGCDLKRNRTPETEGEAHVQTTGWKSGYETADEPLVYRGYAKADHSVWTTAQTILSASAYVAIYTVRR